MFHDIGSYSPDPVFRWMTDSGSKLIDKPLIGKYFPVFIQLIGFYKLRIASYRSAQDLSDLQLCHRNRR